MDVGFLTDKEIKDKKEELFKLEYGFVDKQANGASYDLSLGEEVYITGRDYPETLSEKKPFVTIPRGQFALLMTKEYVQLPKNYMALISIRFSIKAQGLINVSGFHIDPGFEGRILFSVFNAGPTDVILKYGSPTFMIFFNKLKESVQNPYCGNRNGQKHLPIDLVTSLKGTSASLSDVDKRVSQLETSSKVYWALLIALIGGLLVLFLRGIFGG